MSCNLKNESCGWKCTGYEGSHIWKAIRDSVNKIECETCKEDGLKLVSFMQDVVHVGLGLPIFDKKNFESMSKRLECIISKSKDHGI